MRTSLVTRLGAALVALPLCALAAPSVAPSAAPVSMTGVTDTGDTVELRFDAAPSTSATLQIKGDRTGSPAKTFPCSYELEPSPPGALESPVVKITFDNRQSMTIACDPLSDTCHADSYPSVGGASFSILWRITRADTRTDTQTAQTRARSAR